MFRKMIVGNVHLGKRHSVKPTIPIFLSKQQQYHVVLMGTGWVGLKRGLGRRASWAVHGSVQGWCLHGDSACFGVCMLCTGWWVCWIGEIGPEHWGLVLDEVW